MEIPAHPTYQAWLFRMANIHEKKTYSTLFVLKIQCFSQCLSSRKSRTLQGFSNFFEQNIFVGFRRDLQFKLQQKWKKNGIKISLPGCIYSVKTLENVFLPIFNCLFKPFLIVGFNGEPFFDFVLFVLTMFPVLKIRKGYIFDWSTMSSLIK